MRISRFIARILPASLLALVAPLAVSAQLLTNNGTVIAVQPGLTLAVNGGMNISAGSTFANAGVVQLTGNLNSFAAMSGITGIGVWRFTGSQAQALNVASGTTLGTVEQANTGPAGNNRLNVGQNLIVSNQLLLTNGLVGTPPTTTITLPIGATLSGEATGRYVQGNLEVIRNATGVTNFGHGLVLDATGQSLGQVSATRTAGLLTANVSYGTSLGANPKGIDRMWAIEPLAQPTAAIPITMSWLPDDDNGLTTFSAAQIWQQPTTGGTWVARGMPGNSASRTITRSAITLNRFTVSGSTAPAAAPPTLTNIAPASGNAGTSVQLTGTNFVNGASTVSFNGSASNNVIVWSATSATAAAPLGVTTGNVTITTPDGTSNGQLFTVTAPPVITNFTPQTGPVGTSVTITGTNLTGTTSVVFASGVSAATFAVVNSTTVTVTVPVGAVTGTFELFTPFGSAVSPQPFTVPSLAPTLTSLNPVSGIIGSTVTLAGTNFTNATAIRFGFVPSVTFTVLSPTSATAVVPAGAVTGNVTVVTPNGTSNGQTFIVTPSPVPTLTSVLNDATGLPSGPRGASVTLTGTGLTGATLVTFAGGANNTVTSGFAWNAAGTQLTGVIVPNGAFLGINGATVTTPGGISNLASFTVTSPLLPTITSFLPTSGPVGTVVTLTGTNFTGATAIGFGGTASTQFNVSSATTATATVPVGASTGFITLFVPNAGTASSPSMFTVTAPPVFPNLVIGTTGQMVAGGTYNSITVTGTGAGTLQGPVTVNASVVVQPGGILSTNCEPLTGAATFTLAAGATLIICDPAGISQSGATGAVQTTGPRSFSDDASYTYGGIAGQDTGNGLPALVRNLTISNPDGLGLTQALAVRRRLRLTAAGNFVLHGRVLTLLSDANGTALIANEGTGVVLGATGKMERYVEASGNLGSSGYRHYSTPVSGATVAGLGTSASGGSFVPVVNSAYNGSATPGTTAPFPTVFDYNEAFIGARVNNLAAFDKGWSSPAALNTSLTVGRGYTVQIGNTEKVAFAGTFNTGTRMVGGLSRGSGPDAGWHLLGNPYPAPLDWGTVGDAGTNGSALNGVDAAAYVFQSTGPYTGQYRAVVNGVGAGSSLIAAGQSFFVRASTAGAVGSVTLTNANRLTTFGASQPVFQRGPAGNRPLLRLSLGLGSLPATPATAQDETFVYYEAGATAAFDGAFDAHKLASPGAYYLATQGPAAAPALSINGRAPRTAGQADEVLPLWFAAPAGAYTLTATELAHFAAPAGGTAVYLRDALAGTLTNLGQTPSYAFTTAPGAPAAGRFELVFRATTALAAAPGRTGSEAAASLYPNPVEAHGAGTAATLAVTGLTPATSRVAVALCNNLGQVVSRFALLIAQGQGQAAVPTQGLAPGVYLLRLTPLDAQGRPTGTLPAQRLLLQP